jgi:hypothetical protein
VRYPSTGIPCTCGTGLRLKLIFNVYGNDPYTNFKNKVFLCTDLFRISKIRFSFFSIFPGLRS